MTLNKLLYLRKFVAPEFVFGDGAACLAGRYARNLGARRVLVVADEGVLRHGCAGPVLESLAHEGLPSVVFLDVSPNPRDSEVMAGAETCRREGCDAIVAVGGGSPMDCAKGIAIVVTNERHISSFEGVDNVPRPGLPLICVPTTAGSSADVSQFAIVSDSRRKLKFAIVSKSVVPDAALIDPRTTTTMDSELTAHTGLDALTHAMEAYASNASSPVTDMHALEAVRLVSASLKAAMLAPQNMEVRTRMMLGSLYAGLAFSNAILGAVHAMAHGLGGLLDLPHGLCNAILLEHVVAANYETAPARYRDMGLALGADMPEACDVSGGRQALSEALRRLAHDVGVNCRLSDLGVRREDLTELAAKALCDPCIVTNPRPLTVEDIVGIYEKAL